MKQKKKYMAVIKQWMVEDIKYDNSTPQHRSTVNLNIKRLFSTKEELFDYIRDPHKGIVEESDTPLRFNIRRTTRYGKYEDLTPNIFFIEWMSDKYDSGLAPNHDELLDWINGNYELVLNTLVVEVYKLVEATEIE